MKATLVTALLLSGSLPATAAPLFDDVVTADASIAAPAGATAALAGPDGLVGGLQGGPVAVTLAAPGILVVTVQDIGAVGDVFEVFADGTTLGTTSHTPVGGPVNSAGTFTVAVAAGAHSIDIWDYVLSYIGAGASPYGGDPLDPTYSPADLLLTINAAAVPEPPVMPVIAFVVLAVTRGWRARRPRA